MTINMTGPQTTDASTETNTIDPSDLLDESGSIDISVIRSRTNRGPGGTAVVDDALCGTLRREILDADSATALAEERDLADSVVRTHISGDCKCLCDVPTVSFRAGEGWTRDQPTLDDFDAEVTR